MFTKNQIRCMVCCMKSDVRVIRTQQESPRIMGFPPVLTSFIISVFNPIAPIASTIMNFDRSLKGEKRDSSSPMDVSIVVAREARTK